MAKKKQDEPLKIDMSFDQAIDMLAKSKPLPKAKKKVKKKKKRQ